MVASNLPSYNIREVFAWSDSTACKLVQFVHNRVEIIISKTLIIWRYVETNQNLGDVRTEKLITNTYKRNVGMVPGG